MSYSLRTTIRLILAGASILALLFLAAGCTQEEPRYNNMPISVHMERLVRGENERTVDQALDAVIAIGARSVPYLIDAWTDNTSTAVRCRLARALEALGPVSVNATPLLVEALNGVDEQLIGCSAYAIGGIGPGAAVAAPRLGELLRSSDTTTQINLLYALGGIGPAASAQVPLILEAVERERTRAAAISALSQMDSAAVDAVLPWLDGGNANRRLAACQVLAGVHGDMHRVLPALAEALEDRDLRVRLYAARALEQAGPQAVSALDNLIHTLGDRDDEVRQAATEAIIAIAPNSGQQTLIQALSHDDAQVREGVVRIIGRYTSLTDSARGPLLQHLGDRSTAVRLAVIDVLSEYGEEIVPTMIERLGSSNVRIRYGAARVLGNIGPRAREAVEPLEAMRDDPDALVRDEVQRALARIRGN